LQYVVAVCCSVLQYVTVCCSVLVISTMDTSDPHRRRMIPPTKLLGSGISTPYTPFCLICDISSELKCISHVYPFEWAGVDIRWFSVDGFDTRWNPSSLWGGEEYACDEDYIEMRMRVRMSLSWHVSHRRHGLYADEDEDANVIFITHIIPSHI